MKSRFVYLPLTAILASVVNAGGAGAEQVTDAGTIEVYGGGETRQVQMITRQDYLQSAPGTSPIKALNELPGVNYEAADPYGAYEWATRISIRGFNQNQLGFTLDDVPLGDMSYGNFNGLHISRALIDENLGRTAVSQGTGSLDTASTSNLGGAVQFFSIDPTDELHATAAQTFGTENTYRTFVRLDSGKLPGDGKFYVSYARQDQDKWKGVGSHHYDQVNAKFVQPFRSSKLTTFFDYSDRQEIDYQDLSKEYLQKLGYYWDNYYPNLQLAIDSANGIYHHGEDQTSDPIDAAYYEAAGLRRDYLGYVSLDTALTDSLSWKTTFYGHGDQGVGVWATPFTPTPGPNGSPLSERTSEYGIQRFGVLTALTWEAGAHTINTGVWYENDDFTLARRFYPIFLTGALYSPFDMPDPSTAFRTQWAYQFNTDTFQYHLQDTWQVTDNLALHAGFKSLYTNTNGTPTVNNTGTAAIPSGAIEASEGFLPQFGANWKITPNDEVFADVAKNMRAFQQGGRGFGASPWGTATQAAFQAVQKTIRPETSWTYEAGYRFHRAFAGPAVNGVEGLLTAYHVDFSDRLLAIGNTGIAGNPTVLTNVGGVTTNGVELSGAVHLFDRVTWYNAFSYDDSTYDSNYSSGGTVVNTAGKTVVDTPRFLYKTDLSYQTPRYFVRLNADYVSVRYFTYTNDQAVSPRWLFNFGAGYSFGEMSRLSDVSLQFNIYNLLDEKYVSTIGTNGFTASGDNQTLQVGAPRQFFITLVGKF